MVADQAAEMERCGFDAFALRADQKPRASLLDIGQYRREGTFAARRIAVESRDALLRIQRLQLLGHALRARADGYALLPTTRASPVERPLCAAVMTLEAAARCVHGHACIAVVARLGVEALATEQRGRVAASI